MSGGVHDGEWSPETCQHLSLTGVDQTPLSDPAKVWRCDECGRVETSDQMIREHQFMPERNYLLEGPEEYVK